MPVCLREQGLCSTHTALALLPTTEAPQGCERAVSSEQSTGRISLQLHLDQAAPLHHLTALARLARFPDSCHRSEPAAKHLGFRAVKGC